MERIKIDLVEAINAAVDQIEEGAPGKLHLLVWLEAQAHNSIVEVEVPCMTCINHHDMNMHDDTCIHDMHGTLKDNFGMPDKVIGDIVNRYNADTIAQHVEYTLFAKENGLIRKTAAAYFVASISGRWKPPKGYKKESSWFTADEAELVLR